MSLLKEIFDKPWHTKDGIFGDVLLPLTQNEFDEAQHQRVPKGEPGGGEFTSGGGESATATKTKQSSLVKGLLERADKVPITDEVLEKHEHADALEEFDADEVENRMTRSEVRAMESHLEVDKDQWINDQMMDFNADVDVGQIEQDEHSPADINSSLIGIIKESYVPSNVMDRIREELDDWEMSDARSKPWKYSGATGIYSALKRLDDQGLVDAEIKDKVNAYADKVQSDVDERVQRATDELESEERDRLAELYDDEHMGDKEDYLRSFFDEHKDEERFAGTPEPEVESDLNKWGKENPYASNRIYRFVTSTGHAYEITAAVSTKTINDKELKSIGLAFSDSNGEYKVTGAGSAVEVFRKVTDAIAGLVKKQEPDVITFSALDKPHEKLYDRLSRTVVAAFPGYSLATIKEPREDGKDYYVVKREHLKPLMDYRKEHFATSEATVETVVNKLHHPDDAGIDPRWFTDESVWS